MAELAAELSGNPLTDGLTLSGGEPFCQAAECAALARIARERGLNVWAYTGYTYERLLAGEVPDALALLEQVDVLVDGPFVEAEKSYAALFRGSANQRLIDVPKSLAAGRWCCGVIPGPLHPAGVVGRAGAAPTMRVTAGPGVGRGCPRPPSGGMAVADLRHAGRRCFSRSGTTAAAGRPRAAPTDADDRTGRAWGGACPARHLGRVCGRLETRAA
ncbi:MAG: 4Fe-4S single cluster domain-containing protein [Flavonifractor plautii]